MMEAAAKFSSEFVICVYSGFSLTISVFKQGDDDKGIHRLVTVHFTISLAQEVL